MNIKRNQINMNKSVLVKVIVMSFLSIIWGLYIYFDELRKSALGKDEYLKRQSIYFDRYLLHPEISVIIGALFLGIILFGPYELITHFLLKRSRTDNKIPN